MRFCNSTGRVRSKSSSGSCGFNRFGCRNQRLAELANISSSSIFNQVYPVQKPEYSREVTEASKEAYVLVHLSSSLGGNMESRLLTELWREMARKFGHVKFCEIQADMCIEGYPERNTPTILVYHNGDIKEQIVTLKALGGEQTRMTGKKKENLNFQSFDLGNDVRAQTLIFIADLEAILIDVGAVKAKDQRVARSRSGDDQVDGKLRRGRMSAGDDDDDWD